MNHNVLNMVATVTCCIRPIGHGLDLREALSPQADEVLDEDVDELGAVKVLEEGPELAGLDRADLLLEEAEAVPVVGGFADRLESGLDVLPGVFVEELAEGVVPLRDEFLLGQSGRAMQQLCTTEAMIFNQTIRKYF